ncbi:hypothetical protein ABER99_21500 [Paenibacillus glucanolyticus]|jgi:hypothetical protein|uniref:Uncharacterized protein n=1 Tax=Paenibacillus glucanolyticus TaxID=59843 RepID=A0A163GUY8_9BACL|nr:hypothetical protein [Paenibacillus glucanolyticus]KZS45168.1 hypothetical protein AWU65_04080 [Paenibacillus glucanolyticus]OMF63867.1 hypothetical protein BK142_32435 [Paenibacillus glucanolyticus]
MKKKIIGGIIAVLIVAIILQVPNNLRYKLENAFGDPYTNFYGVYLGVMLNEIGGGYEEEISLDDQYKVDIDLAKYSGHKVDLFLYGRYVNSSDPLVIILNGKVIYNGQPEKEAANFYSKNYIKKHFVVDLTGSIQENKNKLMVTTGNATEEYELNIVK